MFAVIYRGKVAKNKEADYVQSWKIIARFFIQSCGAIGSCLHQAEDGTWLAYSRWPSKSMRDKAWPGIDADPSILPEAIKEAFVTLKACVIESYPETCMEVVEDLI